MNTSGLFYAIKSAFAYAVLPAFYNKIPGKAVSEV
jgi:hypothetical protein